MNFITRGIQGLFEAPDEREQWSRLSSILEFDQSELRHLAQDRRLAYCCYEIKKRDGRKRSIAAPSGMLKGLQRRLCKNYLNELSIHDAAHAFRKHHSIKTHARIHVGQELVLTSDIQDFFPQTQAKRVRVFFREQGWSGKPLHLLQRLTCFRDGLPQGAPTSPVLSNLVNEPLDSELAQLAMQHRARYSRYCDDLAFSWSVDVEPDAFRVCVEGILERFGYQLQSNKGWSAQHRRDRPEVTGVAIHGYRLRPSKELHRKRKQLSKAVRKSPKLWPKLQGLLAFWRFLQK